MALTLHNRRWYPLLFLIGIALVIGVWLRFEAGHRPELLVSAIGGVAGFTYFLYRQHLDEAKLFKEPFVEFNARYDALSDGLNAILFGPSEGTLTADERERLFSFFNLCSEEYFFYKVGYIDRHVWYRGMKVFFKHRRIRELWEQDCKADSYYGFRPPEPRGLSVAPGRFSLRMIPLAAEDFLEPSKLAGETQKHLFSERLWRFRGPNKINELGTGS